MNEIWRAVAIYALAYLALCSGFAAYIIWRVPPWDREKQRRSTGLPR